MRILVIEDDERISAPIREEFQRQHYVVQVADDGEEGLSLASIEPFDLILLDLNLPKLDGIAVCQRLRKTGFTGAILMLTARGDKFDKIAGLDAGADDYVVKPFDMDELSARIRALMRRGPVASSDSTINHGEISVDLRACSVSFGANKVELTPTEYRILITFLRNPKRTLSRQEIIERLWHYDEAPTESAIKSHIKGLRSKFVQAGYKSEIVETVFGFGYRLKQ